MADKREYRKKPDSTGGKAGMIDPGKKIETKKDPGADRRDMEFAEAMEADMDRYSRGTESGRTVDEDWKDSPEYDGNKNIETGRDLTFIDKMYTPVIKKPESAERGDENLKSDNRDIEFGKDNTYFRNKNDSLENIEQRKDRPKK